MTQQNLIRLGELAQFLNQFFAVERYDEAERGGVYVPSVNPISRLGLALEPWANLTEWVITQNLDGLFLHRPWQLELGQLPDDVGVIAYHLPFDERLTLGFNLRLAQLLGMSSLSVLGIKQGREIGMSGDIPPQPLSAFDACVDEIFAGTEAVIAGDKHEVSRIAVVGAMTNELVGEAALRGVDVYITGQLRQPAQKAVVDTKIAVIAVGHRRCEAWGLRALAGILRERFFNIEVILPD